MFVHHEIIDQVGVAFTDRRGGVSRAPYDSLNLGRSDRDDPAAVVENLRRVRHHLDEQRPVGAVVTVAQVHGVAVAEVDESSLTGWDDQSTVGDAVPGRPRLAEADAIITAVPGVALAIRVADCLPILLAAPGAGVVAAVHAGRNGLSDGIVPAVVNRLRDRVGSAPLRAWIGPAVCGACYEVPADLRADVAARVPAVAATTSWGTPSLDLAAGAHAQLTDLDVATTRIERCTRTDPDLFSHRRDGVDSGRQCGVVWVTG